MIVIYYTLLCFFKGERTTLPINQVQVGWWLAEHYVCEVFGSELQSEAPEIGQLVI